MSASVSMSHADMMLPEVRRMNEAKRRRLE